jgi:hypothetical protein
MRCAATGSPLPQPRSRIVPPAGISDRKPSDEGRLLELAAAHLVPLGGIFLIEADDPLMRAAASERLAPFHIMAGER